MGIYIPDVEMPKNEPMLVKINPDGSVSTTAKNNYRKYEAIPVPLDHGRLVDVNKLFEALSLIPTVIPAEPSECKISIGGSDVDSLVKTNFDRLHAMSVEELAAWIAEHPVVASYDENNPQHKAWLEWLEKEADA